MDRGKLAEYERSIKKEIANNIKVLLHQENMTQKHLSEKTGIPTSTISDYLNENSLAKTGNIKKIANALGVTKDKIDPRFDDWIEVKVNDESRLKFIRELEQELDVDLTDVSIQNKLKRTAKIIFEKD